MSGPAATLVLAACLALVVSLASPVAWLPLLRRLGAVDVPSDRSSHTVPTARGVGLGPASGLLVAGSAAVAVGVVPASLLTVLAVALAAALLGLFEDVHGVPVPARLGLQLGLGLAAGVALRELTGSPAWWLPLVAVGFAGYVNAANFMDGIDGISAGHAVVCGGYFALLGSRAGSPELVLGGALLATAYLGFAPWNLGPGRVFLGDCGSYLLGAAAALLALLALAAGLPLLVAVAPLLPYLADTALTLARRTLRGEPVWRPHRSHAYQRLVRQGFAHLPVAGLVALAAALCGTAAWLGAGGPVAWLGCVVVLAAYLTSPVLAARLRPGGVVA